MHMLLSVGGLRGLCRVAAPATASPCAGSRHSAGSGRLRRRCLGLGLGALALAVAGPACADAFEDIGWLALVPKDWKPQDRLDRVKAQSLKDGDELAQLMMRELRQVLDSAPVVQALDGRRVKLPGFVVPLEGGPQGLREFLLVPYHGACIHTPPPPANQIVHVRSPQPLKDLQAMSAIWVRGTLRAERADTDMGVSGYALLLESAQPYRGP
jgi:uncharacterized protein